MLVCAALLARAKEEREKEEREKLIKYELDEATSRVLDEAHSEQVRHNEQIKLWAEQKADAAYGSSLSPLPLACSNFPCALCV